MQIGKYNLFFFLGDGKSLGKFFCTVSKISAKHLCTSVSQGNVLRMMPTIIDFHFEKTPLKKCFGLNNQKQT